MFAATKDLAYGGRAVTLRHSMALHPLARTDRSVPTKGLGDAVLALAAVIAGVVFAGPLFVRWQTRKDGVRQRYWRNAGSWEIVGLAVFLALALMAMGQN